MPMARLYPDPSAFGDVRRRIAAALDADGDFLMQQWQGGGAPDCEEWPLPEPMLIEEA